MLEAVGYHHTDILKNILFEANVLISITKNIYSSSYHMKSIICLFSFVYKVNKLFCENTLSLITVLIQVYGIYCTNINIYCTNIHNSIYRSRVWFVLTMTVSNNIDQQHRLDSLLVSINTFSQFLQLFGASIFENNTNLA